MNSTDTKLGKSFTLPGTTITLNRLGYGSMQLAGKGVWGLPRDPEAAVAVLREAVALGVNHIDTSDFYGPHTTNRNMDTTSVPNQKLQTGKSPGPNFKPNPAQLVVHAPLIDWNRHGGLIALALGYQWFYNGANFLAFKVAGDVLHPLMVATLRFSIAALFLLPFALFRWQRSPPSARELGGAALIGVTMLVVSQALAIWGTHFLPAGVAAVFGSTAPLFLALFAWGLFHRPLTRRQVAGVATGFVGLVLMGWTSATGAGFRPIGAVLELTAAAAWAAGSLLAPRLTLPRDPVIGLSTQLAAASLVLGAIVTVSGITARTDLARVPPSAWEALAFLVVASTLVGYAVFLTLNAKVSPALANTFNYAAPVIALCLSALLLHEPLTIMKLLAGGIALGGVALMIDRKAPDARQPGHPEDI